MYLQITTRCNMHCAHCCYSCTEKGQDMSREVALAALKYANMGDCVTIGGGEPTVHPRFWDILGLSLVHSEPDMGVHVITNGKNGKDAKRLARLARRGIIGVELSQDRWHEEIDESVVQSFTEGKREKYAYGDNRPPDLRGIRSVRSIIRQGRGSKIGTDDGCCCEDLLVAPDGSLWACGCKKECFGTVFHPAIPEEYYERDSRCSKAKRKPVEPVLA